MPNGLTPVYFQELLQRENYLREGQRVLKYTTVLLRNLSYSVIYVLYVLYVLYVAYLAYTAYTAYTAYNIM